MKVHSLGNDMLLEEADSVYYFEVSSRDRSEVEDSVLQDGRAMDWEEVPIQFGAYNILRYGDGNDIPRMVRDVLSKNHLAPRIIKKHLHLRWGRGPELYKKVKDGKNIVLEYGDDSEIQAWLDSWEYRKYLRAALVDFNHVEGHWTKTKPARSGRIGKPFIKELEHISSRDARLAYRVGKDAIPTHVALGNWISNSIPERIYPLITERTMANSGVGILYSNLYSFCQPHYSLPDLYTVIPWIKRSSSIPFIFETMTKNNLTVRWHIRAPMAYWDAKREILEKVCEQKGVPYKEEMLEELKQEKNQAIAKVLSGAENVGKFVTTDVIKDIIGDGKVVEHAWEFVPIDQKLQDFVSAYLKINEASAQATVSGLGVHQALSNVSASGKSDSGSEQLYAKRNYDSTEVDIAEEIVCDPLNRAIQINFPGTPWRLGFYRDATVREEDVTPKKRINNEGAV